MHRFTNSLIHETSPYLLQHAHNPVNWFAWNQTALQKAKDENKLLLISIGYSSCHWCHVMEHESFEDEQTASIMNEHFVCIKIDREERPDIDAIYMDAVQLMTGRGGWPLNCIALPDQRPLYGGTYFTKEQWQQVLLQVAALFQKDVAQCEQYATELTQGIQRMELVKKVDDKNLLFDFLSIYELFARQFDEQYGGMNRAPKFVMPSNWEFLLQYYYHFKNEKCLQQAKFTLQQIAFGGIYDQLGGGFARYSTDNTWKIPHFEKMLYDNAQLVSLYSNAWKLTHNELFKQIVYETLEFIRREMTSGESGFYSALDADSEGHEGKYYIWTKEELKHILTESHLPVFFDYYSVNEKGFWENDYYILLRKEEEEVIAARNKITAEELHSSINDCKVKLLTEREKRVKPGLDDKQLCSWNALMLKAYTEAYNTFGEKAFLDTAIANSQFITQSLMAGRQLYRSNKNGKAKIIGFLDDYAFTIEAFIQLYQSTGEGEHLTLAKHLTEKVLIDFFEEATGMFYFTSANGEKLIARKMEVQDNVISSSNSVMAKNLFLLSKFFTLNDYETKARQMVSNMRDDITRNAPWFANWSQLALMMQQPFYEIVICGQNAATYYKQFSKHFLPGCIFAFATDKSKIPVSIHHLFENRFVENQTLVYVCNNNTCRLPVKTVQEALLLME